MIKNRTHYVKRKHLTLILVINIIASAASYSMLYVAVAAGKTIIYSTCVGLHEEVLETYDGGELAIDWRKVPNTISGPAFQHVQIVGFFMLIFLLFNVCALGYVLSQTKYQSEFELVNDD